MPESLSDPAGGMVHEVVSMRNGDAARFGKRAASPFRGKPLLAAVRGCGSFRLTQVARWSRGDPCWGARIPELSGDADPVSDPPHSPFLL